MRRTNLVSAACIVIILSGALVLAYWIDQKNDIMRPEGYSSPEKYETGTLKNINLKKWTRVEKLKIEKNISKYYGKILDLVAFTPGSGWIKIKTSDGISPIISFKRTSQKEIRKFNRFSKSLGLPIRVKLSGKELHVFAEETDAQSIFVAKKTESDSSKITGFYNPKQFPELVMRKDKNGNVSLVKAPKGIEQETNAVAKVKNK